MATVVKKVGIKKEKGYLYFVTKGGDIGKAKMNTKGRPKTKRKTTAKKTKK